MRKVTSAAHKVVTHDFGAVLVCQKLMPIHDLCIYTYGARAADLRHSFKRFYFKEGPHNSSHFKSERLPQISCSCACNCSCGCALPLCGCASSMLKALCELPCQDKICTGFFSPYHGACMFSSLNKISISCATSTKGLWVCSKHLSKLC